ncbi:MAG: DUF1214 domain-containing protein [Myxococcota bacterium]
MRRRHATRRALLAAATAASFALAGCASRAGGAGEVAEAAEPTEQRAASAGAAAGASPRGESAAAATTAEQSWNRLDLLDHLAAIGGPESRWDGLASAQSYGLLQRALEEMRQLVLHDAASEQEAAEGLRMLLKVFAMAVDDSLHGDLANPLFRKLDPRWRDVGAYNPDAEYDQAWIDGRYDYRLSGNLGGARYVSVTVNGQAPNASSRLVAYLDDATLRAAADAAGDFTVWLTKAKPAAPGLWIALPETADGVVIRQYLADRAHEPLATFSIEAVGARRPPKGPMRDEEIARRIATVATYLVVNSTWHRTLMPYAMEKPNQFFDRAGTTIGGNVANNENLYHMAHYQLGPDEALVVDFVPPQSPFWNLTAASLWHESERFLTDPVSRTLAEVTPRADGSIRFVLADRDPGLPNWIDTFEHRRGFLILRMVGVASHPLPVVRRVAWKDVASLD